MGALARRLNQNHKLVPIALMVAASLLIGVMSQRSPMLTTAGLIATFIVGWIVVRIEVGLFVLVLLFPLQRSVLGNYGLVLSWFPVVALFIVALVRLAANPGRIWLHLRLPQVLLIVLWGYVLLSLYADASTQQGGAFIVNPLSGGGTAHFRYIAQALLFTAIIGTMVTSADRLRKMVSYLWVVFAIVFLVGLYDLSSMLLGKRDFLELLYETSYGSQSVIGRSGGGLLTGIYAGWTGGAQFANFLISAGFILFPIFYYHTSPRWKRIGTPLLLGALICLYYTKSVGNWLAFAVGLPLLGLLLGRRFHSRTAVVGLIFLLIIWALLMFPSSIRLLPEQAQSKAIDFQRFVLEGASPQNLSVNIRLDLARAGWWMFSQSPLFGMGFATFGRYAPLSGYLGGRDMALLSSASYAHNSYIAILAELGLVGIVLFVTFVYLIIKYALSNIREARDDWLKHLQIGTLVAIVANLIFLADYETWAFDLNFWLPVALTLAIRNVVSRDAEHRGCGGDNSLHRQAMTD